MKWSGNPPVDKDARQRKGRENNLGAKELPEWIEFILDEGFVQFGGQVFQQSTGIFTGMPPATSTRNSSNAGNENDVSTGLELCIVSGKNIP